MRLIKHADGYTIVDVGVLDLARLQLGLVATGEPPLTVAVECGHVVGGGTCTRWEAPK